MTLLNLALRQIGPVAPSMGGPTYDEELDSVTSVLTDICELLADEGSVQFLVEGFGQRWPVDVRTDLAVVVEQVPTALRCLRAGESATLNFYEQGVERLLTIVPLEGNVNVRCSSTTSWRPEPNEIVLKRTEFIQLLTTFCSDFVARASERCPDIVKDSRFREWLRDDGSAP